MSRSLPVVLLVLVTAVGISLAFVPFILCQDCPYEPGCLRCGDRGRITWFESRRREPLDPVLASLLKARGVTAPIAGALAEKHGRPRVDMMGWRETPEFFYYSEATQAEGPGGPLVLTVLVPKVSNAEDGSPCRVVLFDRRGREIDRRDVSMPGVVSGLDGVLERGRNASVLLKAADQEDSPAGPIWISSASATTTLTRKDWPAGWQQRGVVRIIVRNGRLEVAAP